MPGKPGRSLAIEPIVFRHLNRKGKTMHTLVIGMSGSGKTTLVKWLTAAMKKKGIKVAVLDPLLDPEWNADFITSDSAEFMRYVKQNKSHVLVVDESGSAIGRYNEAMNWLATTSRHLGHTTFFIMQGATQVDPIIRGQCSKCFMFTCAGPISDKIAIEMNEPKVSKGSRLKKGCFYLIDSYQELIQGRLDWATKSVKIGVDFDDSTEPAKEEKRDEKPSETIDSGSDLNGDSSL